MDVETEIEKLRYHLRLLADASDLAEHPDTKFIIAHGWGEDDWDDAEEIFGCYEEAVEAGGSINGLEREVKERFNCGYQEVKRLVLAMWDAEVCRRACYEYAKANDTLEMKRIIKEGVRDLVVLDGERLKEEE